MKKIFVLWNYNDRPSWTSKVSEVGGQTYARDRDGQWWLLAPPGWQPFWRPMKKVDAPS